MDSDIHRHRHAFCRLVSRWRSPGYWACLTNSGGTYWLDIRDEEGKTTESRLQVRGTGELVAFLRRYGFSKTAERPAFCCP